MTGMLLTLLLGTANCSAEVNRGYLGYGWFCVGVGEAVAVVTEEEAGVIVESCSEESYIDFGCDRYEFWFDCRIRWPWVKHRRIKSV